VLVSAGNSAGPGRRCRVMMLLVLVWGPGRFFVLSPSPLLCE